MLQYGLTDKDKEQLEYPKQLYSGFGRDVNDFIHFYVYDMEDNLLQDDILKPGDVIYIPPRTYHRASPSGKRLSVSIPIQHGIEHMKPKDRNWYKL